jgi:hypothetical protein
MAKARRRGRPARVNGKAAPKKTKKIDLLIDTIFSVLPATTLEEILTKVAKRWKGKPLDVSDISAALGHLRHNAVEYGWTVPYVSSGAPTDDDRGRFFAVEVKADGSHGRISERNVRHLLRGARRMTATVSTINNSEGVALAIIQPRLPERMKAPIRTLARKQHALAAQERQLLADLTKLEAA